MSPACSQPPPEAQPVSRRQRHSREHSYVAASRADALFAPVPFAFLLDGSLALARCSLAALKDLRVMSVAGSESRCFTAERYRTPKAMTAEPRERPDQTFALEEGPSNGLLGFYCWCRWDMSIPLTIAGGAVMRGRFGASGAARHGALGACPARSGSALLRAPRLLRSSSGAIITRTRCNST